MVKKARINFDHCQSSFRWPLKDKEEEFLDIIWVNCVSVSSSWNATHKCNSFSCEIYFLSTHIHTHTTLRYKNLLDLLISNYILKTFIDMIF